MSLTHRDYFEPEYLDNKSLKIKNLDFTSRMKIEAL